MRESFDGCRAGVERGELSSLGSIISGGFVCGERSSVGRSVGILKVKTGAMSATCVPPILRAGNPVSVSCMDISDRSCCMYNERQNLADEA